MAKMAMSLQSPSVNNVLDKRYYLSQDNVNLWYGDPRNFTLRIDAKY